MAASFRIPAATTALLFLTVSILVAVAHARSYVLVSYEFEDRVPGPNNTVISSATPSGNLSITEFGSIHVVTNLLRKSDDPTSPVLGEAAGLVAFLRDRSIFLTHTFVYDTKEWNGTIEVQGRLRNGDGELAVTGGTGDFRMARGWCNSSLLTDADPAHVVYKNVVFLKL